MLRPLIEALTMNFAETDPSSPDPQLRPLRVSGSPGEAAELVRKFVGRNPRWKLVKDGTDGSHQRLQLVVYSRLFRFKDDVVVTITTDGPDSIVEARSQSRVGKGDLGQNKRNLRELFTGLRER